MICVRCGEAMRMTEKDTSSGRDIREYTCEECGYSDWEDNGTALWQVLSDYRKEDEASRAGTAVVDAPAPTQDGARPIRERFFAWLARKGSAKS